MAALPAPLTCSGVGKSGSPALKSTTLYPARRSRSASAATFSVAEGATCASRCANMLNPLGLWSLDPVFDSGFLALDVLRSTSDARLLTFDFRLLTSDFRLTLLTVLRPPACHAY